ncbi:MAG: hypothetical protein ACUVWV_01315 [Thermodesulfobacteriota bacterium]
MGDIYQELIKTSQEIAASFPLPRFYACCQEWLIISQNIYASDWRVRKCRELAHKELSEDFGHGLQHAEKVALEAGALAYLETQKICWAEPDCYEAGLLAQIAGLLHDLRRNEENHAQASAAAAKLILKNIDFLSAENENYVTQAISNHEAFVAPKEMDTPLGQIVSDALYDADKFRWGPDNFTVTLWEMLRFSKASMERLIQRFPKGMKGIARIKDTFRSPTGKIYGPEFIDLGLQIGEKIYIYLKERFSEAYREE